MSSQVDQEQRALLRSLPAVHRLIEAPALKQLQKEREIPHERLVQEAGKAVDAMRERILRREETGDAENLSQRLQQEVIHRLQTLLSPRLKRVINGTGVVLHTNLGRALLSEEAVRQVTEAAAYYSNLEYDLQSGERGSRHSHVESLICELTGAEAAMVVNNNAAAVYLILREMAKGKEVIVSRGQLVEIGGSFRVSEIMAESGARLVEVGTTNKTHAYDYERAVGEETALLMKVHSSNFRTVGFTKSLSLSEMVELGRKYELPVYEDLGSGVLFDLRPYGVGDEPVVKESIEAGADLVSFSGDKLLGGPQAGIIAGKKRWIRRLKQNQLARVLRVDKMTLAGLDATLRAYLLPEKARREIPTIRDILVSLEEIEEKAKAFIARMGVESNMHLALVDDESAVGGGTLPGVTLPTKAVAIHIPDIPAHRVEARLRAGSPAVVVRLNREQILIDFRTVQWDELDLLAERMRQALA